MVIIETLRCPRIESCLCHNIFSWLRQWKLQLLNSHFRFLTQLHSFYWFTVRQSVDKHEKNTHAHKRGNNTTYILTIKHIVQKCDCQSESIPCIRWGLTSFVCQLRTRVWDLNNVYLLNMYPILQKNPSSLRISNNRHGRSWGSPWKPYRGVRRFAGAWRSCIRPWRTCVPTKCLSSSMTS